MTALVVLGVVVQDHDLVAEEPGGTRPPVRNQGLVLGQFQVELVVQEPADVGLDLLGFPLRSGEPDQPIVRLCRSGGYADVVGSMLVDRGLRTGLVGIICSQPEGGRSSVRRVGYDRADRLEEGPELTPQVVEDFLAAPRPPALLSETAAPR
ncbi:hypothetical protein ACFWDX_59225, partial [Streptomyces mirabilis]|uniref:hypothetical protein n=1 Tax=Streptomyces mirabilis TaxID=68239 RepID=UPI0036554FA7